VEIEIGIREYRGDENFEAAVKTIESARPDNLDFELYPIKIID